MGNHMKSFVRNQILSCLVGAVTLVAQQDSTVQWKAALQDLEQRLTALPPAGETVEAWRSDAEAVRSSIASFAGIGSERL